MVHLFEQGHAVQNLPVECRVARMVGQRLGPRAVPHQFSQVAVEPLKTVSAKPLNGFYEIIEKAGSREAVPALFRLPGGWSRPAKTRIRVLDQKHHTLVAARQDALF